MSKIVPPIGPRDAKLVIIGEAPGNVETSLGQPFMGASGRDLNRALALAGIQREECYITNVLKVQPKSIKDYIDPPRHISQEGHFWINELKRELAGLQPNLILCMGVSAMHTLTGKYEMGKWRGSVIPSYHNVKTISTYHPASAMRGNWRNRYYTRFDVLRAGQQWHTPDMPELDYEFIIGPGFTQSMEYLDWLRTQPLVAFDIECIKQQEVSCISFAAGKREAICIPFVHRGRHWFSPPQEAAIWRAIALLLEDPKILKLAHNATFDRTFLYGKYGIHFQNVQDTMLAQGLLYPDFRKGLAFVTSQYTLIPYYKDDGKELFSAQDNEQFWRYNCMDSLVLQIAYPHIMSGLEQAGNMDTFLNQNRLIPILQFMTDYGMRMDTVQMAEKSLAVTDEVAVLAGQLQEEVGYELNANSAPQVQDYFYNVLDLEPYKKKVKQKNGTYKQVPTCDEKALKRLVRRGYSEARLILDIRGLLKLRNSYLEMDIDKDGRLRSSMKPIAGLGGKVQKGKEEKGKGTLRISSGKTIYGTGGNVQNLPARFKLNLVPDTGYVGIEIDYSQAEDRCVAYIAPEKEKIRGYESGLDPHARTASFMFQRMGYKNHTYEEILRLNKLYKQGQKDEETLAPIGQGLKPWRYWGKEGNHALNYGLHWKSAALRWEIPETEAKRIYLVYHEIYPGVKAWHRWVDAQLAETRKVENLFGYERKFLGPEQDIRMQAYNFMAQSTVAECINRWGLQYIYYNQDLFPEVVLLNQVHDSIWFQLPLEAGWPRISEILSKIVTNMEQELSYKGRVFRLPTEVKLMPRNFGQGVEVEALDSETLEQSYHTELRRAA